MAAAPDDAAAQRVDFAFFTELAEAAGNVVFVLIVNSIRALYFEHAAGLPVTARHEELAPLYARAARAVADGDSVAAREAVGDWPTDSGRGWRRRCVSPAKPGGYARPEAARRHQGRGPEARKGHDREEANVFACLVDTIVAPGGALPPLARTDAMEFLDG